MKSINSKDIGKTNEEIIIEAFKKALEEACKNYIGQPTDIVKTDFETLVKHMQKYNAVSMGCSVSDKRCLICGSICCEEDDCQLGVE